MSRRLMALNVGLAILLAVGCWRLWSEMRDAAVQETAIAAQPLEPVQIPPSPPAPPPAPVVASDYIQVAQEALFFADRNPNVAIEAEAPKPLPPMPVAHGILDLGNGPTVILSENETAPQRGYRVGDEYEDFRIVEITPNRLVFDWEGERVSRTLEELKPDETAAPAVRTASSARTSSAKASPAKAKSSVLGESAKPGPSQVEMGSGVRACKPDDASPAGTVVDGFRKVVSRTPFGQVCRWERVE